MVWEVLQICQAKLVAEFFLGHNFLILYLSKEKNRDFNLIENKEKRKRKDLFKFNMIFCEEFCSLLPTENIWNASIYNIYHWFWTEILFELCYSAPLNFIKLGFVFTWYFFCRYANDAYFILALANCSPNLNKIKRYNMSKVTLLNYGYGCIMSMIWLGILKHCNLMLM